METTTLATLGEAGHLRLTSNDDGVRRYVIDALSRRARISGMWQETITVLEVDDTIGDEPANDDPHRFQITEESEYSAPEDLLSTHDEEEVVCWIEEELAEYAK